MPESQRKASADDAPHADFKLRCATLSAVVCIAAILAAVWLPNKLQLVGSAVRVESGGSAAEHATDAPHMPDSPQTHDREVNSPPLNSRLWWMAPFFSGGGYSSEAISFAAALSDSSAILPGRLWISQHGDGFRPGILQVDQAAPALTAARQCLR